MICVACAWVPVREWVCVFVSVSQNFASIDHKRRNHTDIVRDRHFYYFALSSSFFFAFLAFSLPLSSHAKNVQSSPFFLRSFWNSHEFVNNSRWHTIVLAILIATFAKITFIFFEQLWLTDWLTIHYFELAHFICREIAGRIFVCENDLEYSFFWRCLKWFSMNRISSIAFALFSPNKLWSIRTLKRLHLRRRKFLQKINSMNILFYTNYRNKEPKPLKVYGHRSYDNFTNKLK